MELIIVLAVVILIIFPSVFNKKRSAQLTGDDLTDFNEIKSLMKNKPFSNQPKDLNDRQKKLWRLALKEKQSDLYRIVFQITGFVVVIFMVIAMLNK